MFTVPKTMETLLIERVEGIMEEAFVRDSGNTYPESLVFGRLPGKNEGLQGISFIGHDTDV